VGSTMPGVGTAGFPGLGEATTLGRPAVVKASSPKGLGKFPGVHLAQLLVSAVDDGGSKYPTSAE